MNGGTAEACWACSKKILRIVASLVAIHAVLFVIFDLLPSSELKLGGWMVADSHAVQHFRNDLGSSNTDFFSRYLVSLGRLGRLDFGNTLAGYSVSTVMGERLLTSLPTLMVALIFCFLVPTTLALWRLTPKEPRGGFFVRRLIGIGLAPPFITAALLKAVAVLLGWHGLFRQGGMGQLWSLSAVASILPLAMVSSVACAEAGSVMQKPFVTTLVSQGIPDQRIRFILLANIWRAVRPILARAMIQLIGGLVFAEIVWDAPGFGRLFSEGLQTGDYNLLQAWMLAVGTIILSLTSWEDGK